MLLKRVSKVVGRRRANKTMSRFRRLGIRTKHYDKAACSPPLLRR